jgi:hypothetical protein
MNQDHPLDGKYRVTSTTSGPRRDIEKRSDGETEIKNSQTHRRDDANCEWTSTFTILSDSQVRMVSVADASRAAVDFLLTAPDGSPTRGPVTYEAILKYAAKGEQIQLSGQIEYGLDVVFLTMRKIP